MAERADDVDAQDLAEVYDEDNLDTDGRRLRLADEELNADDLPNLFDVTRARGDEDEDEAMIGEDLDDEEIVALGREEDEEGEFGDEEEEDQEDETQGPVGEDEEDEDEGFEAARTGARGGGGDEVGLTYVGDVSDRLGAHSAAQRYEARSLDEDDLASLGYGPDEAERGAEAPDAALPAPKSASRDEAAERRLDEGVEETFPASDPVSVKHIT
jgi:hypothetical protein